MSSRPRAFVDALLLIAAVLCAAILIRAFVVESYRIPTGSMEPTLLPGDAVLVSKLAYGAHGPETISFLPQFRLPGLSAVRRGDVVAARLSDPVIDPDGRDRVFIKRCVALPGDTVTLSGRDVRVNGLPPAGPPEHGFTLREIPPPVDTTRIIIPARGSSISLSPGTIDVWKNLIASEGHRVTVGELGEVLIDGAERTVYVAENDCVYLLGDNCARSRDSREWGPVREDALIGKVALVYWSLDRRGLSGSLASRVSAVRWSRIGTVVR